MTRRFMGTGVARPILPMAFCRMIETFAIVMAKEIPIAAFVNGIQSFFHNGSPCLLLEVGEIF
jgi:hypothetical protein